MNPIEELVKLIAQDWDWNPHDSGRKCKFCGIHQPQPKREQHGGHCPRLIWAIGNDDTPRRRMEILYGKPFPTWGSDYKAFSLTRPYLSSEGRKFLEILATVWPETYYQHHRGHLQLVTDRDKMLNHD